MNEGRREFLIGLGSAIVSGAATYAGYRYMLESPRTAGSSAPCRDPAIARAARPTLELAPIRAELGHRFEHGSAPELAFDRRAPFAEVREILRSHGPIEVALAVEVRSSHRDVPYTAALPILLDVGPEPGMLAQDAQRRAEQAAMEAMPTPWTYTGIHVGRAGIMVDHGGELESLAVPSLDVEAPWTGSMWTMAQRAGVSRLHGRWPWIFADDDATWGLVVRVIEATAPPPCQPIYASRERSLCTQRWATLFVGAPA